MARTTINVKHNSKADLERQLESMLRKVRAGDLTPGADLTFGNTRVQVATPQEDPIRAFARAQGIPVGSRGRFSKELIAAYEAHQAGASA